MKPGILIIEDETGIAETLSYTLSQEGFETRWVVTGSEGLACLRELSPALVILDLGLPDCSGLDLLKEIRQGSDVPVLILTARSGEIDRVLGLELGADDYVVKPFSPRELTSRIKAILRRSGKSSPPAGPGVPFAVERNKRQISYYGEKLILSRTEFEILSLLIERPGWVFTREKLMDLVWTEPEESFERTVDAHIKALRAKLRAVRPDSDPIETRRGVGYALKESL